MAQQENKFILASASPRRRQLLGDLGYTFGVIPSEYDESADRADTHAELVQSIAYHKAKDVFKSHREHVILGADTIVTMGNTVLGKPKDKADAFEMLSTLSNSAHTVFTGVCVLTENHHKTLFVATDVTFYEMDEKEIRSYIETNEPMDKAGAYGIQKYGSVFVKSIHGNYTNVVGLPIPQTVRLLAEFGINSF